MNEEGTFIAEDPAARWHSYQSSGLENRQPASTSSPGEKFELLEMYCKSVGVRELKKIDRRFHTNGKMMRIKF